MSMRDPAASDPDDYVKSPCIRVCTLDPRTDICVGCLRTLDEIRCWGSLPAAGKRAILAELETRRRAGAPRR